MIVNDSESRRLLIKECANAEQVWREILRQEEVEKQIIYLEETPIKPWIIDQAEIILLYKTSKTSFFYGHTSGEGIVIARLPSAHRNLVAWSAPLFIKINSRSFGLSFGHQSATTFSVATARGSKKLFASTTGRPIQGMDFNFGFGAKLRERADILSTNLASDIGFISVSKVEGTIFDLSFFVTGAMAPDLKKCQLAYGADYAAKPLSILSKSGSTLPEFQPFYGELSRVVNTVEHPAFNPARVSASLERFSSGSDPDRVIVMPDGVVIREDLKEPPPLS